MGVEAVAVGGSGGGIVDGEDECAWVGVAGEFACGGGFDDFLQGVEAGTLEGSHAVAVGVCDLDADGVGRFETVCFHRFKRIIGLVNEI